jgi:hypothetical protein
VVVRALVAIGAWIVPEMFLFFVHTSGEGGGRKNLDPRVFRNQRV